MSVKQAQVQALAPPREPLACLTRARQLVTLPDVALTTTEGAVPRGVFPELMANLRTAHQLGRVRERRATKLIFGILVLLE